MTVEARVVTVFQALNMADFFLLEDVEKKEP